MIFRIAYYDANGKHAESHIDAPHLSNVLDLCKWKHRTLTRICKIDPKREKDEDTYSLLQRLDAEIESSASLRGCAGNEAQISIDTSLSEASN